MYPSGIDGNEEFLSLYLHMAKPDGDASLQNSGVLVEVSLSIKDKVTSNRNTKAGLSLVPAPTVTWSRCSDRYDYLCCSMNLGYVLCASRPVSVPSDRGLRWLGMGKVHGDEVSQGLVPCEGQLLNRGRCRHRWIVQDGIGIIDSTCACVEPTLELCSVGIVLLVLSFWTPNLNVAVHYIMLDNYLLWQSGFSISVFQKFRPSPKLLNFGEFF